VFNAAWLKRTIPPDPLRFRKWGLAATIATMLLAAWLIGYQFRMTEAEQAQQYITSFETETNPTLRLDALVNLLTFSNGKYQTEAMNRFYSQSRITQTLLLSESNLPDRAKTLVAVAYPTLRYQLWLTDSNTILLKAMQSYITDTNEAAAVEYWLEGRKALQNGDYDSAKLAYHLAIKKSDKNALLYIEQGLAYTHLGEFDQARQNFDYVATHHITITGLIPYLLRLEHPELVTKSIELSRFIQLPLASGGTEGGSMALIPAGPFIMGSTNAEVEAAFAACQKIISNCPKELFERELPRHTVYLADYYIDKYEITNADYAACVKDKKCTLPQNTGSYIRGKYYDDPDFAKYPVIYIDWTQAKEYCVFAGKRLPTEAEWEKAARGLDGRIYSWGNEFDGTKLNFCDKNCTLPWADEAVDDGYGNIAPSGSYELGKSSYGVYDMAGNVWEWTSSEYRNYPYQADDGRENLFSNNDKVFRGGAVSSFGLNVRAAFRNLDNPTYNNLTVGFRCAQ
jgi:formylglycine-generating enzyme required for sulfatase activity